jgi:hypothetical protein
LEKRKIFVPTAIQILDHPEGGKDTPRHHASQNITLEQVQMAALCYFTTLKENLYPF